MNSTTSLDLSQAAAWEIFVPSTGRTVAESPHHLLVMNWAKSAPSKMASHEGAKTLRESLDNFEPSKESSVEELYRGISFAEGKTPSREEMGPPPIDQCRSGGRYHTAGNAVLYLSDSIEGVRRERDAWGATGNAYIQKYQLLLNRLKIADFTAVDKEHFLAHVFLWAERCNYQDGSDSYDFSQIVARLVSEKFDGMVVPGVRGVAGSTYSNIVLFKPHEPEGRWMEWLEDSEPFPLDSGENSIGLQS